MERNDKILFDFLTVMGMALILSSLLASLG